MAQMCREVRAWASGRSIWMATTRLEPSELQQGCYVYEVIHMMMEWMSICVVELDVIINMPVRK